MPNEFNAEGKIVLRDSSGNQMSLPRFFQLALVGEGGAAARPTSYYHTDAWDMGAPEDKVPVRTPVFGTVTTALQTGYNDSMGTCVIIDDGNGHRHCFFHMVENSLVVAVGDSVSQGDKLGMIGNTGHSFGAHLHYDVREGRTRIGDPMLAYDCSTLPAGWNFGDAAAAQNWDYIPLDKTATDYGPPGGDVPSEPFFTDSYVYDLSTWQTSAEVQELCNDSTTGGFILRFAWNSNQDGGVASHLSAAKSSNIPLGFYSASDKNITNDGEAAYRAMLEAQAEILYTNLNVKPTDCSLGVWLDLESWGKSFGTSGCGMSATPAENVRQIELFIEIFSAKGYSTVGWYSNKNELVNGVLSNADASWKEFPYWYARPGVSRSTVDSEMSSYGIPNCYLWQDGDGGSNWSPDKTYKHKNVDNDTVLQPIPTAGGGDGGGGGGGTGSYTEVIKVTVDVTPPKRIYFSPVPGIIETEENNLLSDREAIISIITDADNAALYYTTDGSSPYNYVYEAGTTVYTLAANAIPYDGSITIHKDTHIRVIAVPAGLAVDEAFAAPLAKGSGTYLFQYRNVSQDWEQEKTSYETSDDSTSFFEENRQAFLLLHDMLTQEEVLYSDPFKHDTESQEEDAEDNATRTGSASPSIIDESSGGVDNVSD